MADNLDREREIAHAAIIDTMIADGSTNLTAHVVIDRLNAAGLLNTGTDSPVDTDKLWATKALLRDAEQQIVRLIAWRTSAIAVMGEWDEVFKALGSPGRLGESMPANSLAEVQRLVDDQIELRRLKALVADALTVSELVDHWSECPNPPDAPCDCKRYFAAKQRLSSAAAYLEQGADAIDAGKAAADPAVAHPEDRCPNCWSPHRSWSNFSYPDCANSWHSSLFSRKRD